MPIITVITETNNVKINAESGTNLRRLLLDHDLSPYTSVTAIANCGGRGLCATCGVWIESGEPAPAHWHDKLAYRFGYPRLSCQVTITDDMTIKLLPDKWIWGRRDADRARERRAQRED